MKYLLTTEEREHLSAIGHPVSIAQVECEDQELREAEEAWRRSLPDASYKDIRKRALAHVAHQQHHQAKAAEVKPVAHEHVHRLQWKQILLILGALLALLVLVPHAHCQFSHISTITGQNNDGSPQFFYASPFVMKAGSNCSWNVSGAVATFNCSATVSSVAWDAIINPTAGGLTLSQFANGNDFLIVKRKTDTLPTGSFFRFQTALGADICALSIAGVFSGCSFPYANLSGTPTLPANTTATAHNFFTAYNSTTGAFTKAQPVCGDLSDAGTLCTSSAALAQTIASVSHKWLNSYTASTGAFTQTQPACADLSDSGNGCSNASQLQNLVLASPDGSSGSPAYRALVAGDIPSLPESQITSLVSDLLAKSPVASPTFTGTVTIPALTLSGITGSTQCLHASTLGVVTGTGSDCGSGSGMSNPMTTLGDIIYEDATPVPARLAGNTTSTKKFLRQTGTGSVSAVPAWDTVTSADVGLGSVTNDAQTKASVMPNTAPGAGQIPLGNAGGTAYVPQSFTQDCTVTSAGVVTCLKTNNVAFATSATTDTTNAANIGSGTLPAGRMPALTGAVTSSAGTVATSPGKIDVLDSSRFCQAAGASSTTYTCNLSPAITAYVTGTHYGFKADVANTAASTINLNGQGAKTIKKAAGGITTDLVANDMQAGQWVDLVYDGTNMQMQSTLGNAPGGGSVSGSTGQPVAMTGTNVAAGVTPLSFRSSTYSNVESATGHGDSIYTILATDRFVYTNAAFSASRTWTLPAASAVNAGGAICVFDLQGTVTGVNTLVISRAGSDTINAAATTFTFSAANDGGCFVSDGTSKWAMNVAPTSIANGGTGTGSTLTGIVRGGNPMTAAELSGDCATSGSNAVICTQINGANFTVNSSGLPTKVDGITTAGQGVSIVQCITSAKTETGADAALLSCTPASAVGNYEVCISLDVSAATSATLGWTMTWTNSKGTAVAPTNMSLFQMGVAAPAVTFTAAASNSYYQCVPIQVNNAGTAIVVKTTFSGTSIAYNASATVRRII